MTRSFSHKGPFSETPKPAEESAEPVQTAAAIAEGNQLLDRELQAETIDILGTDQERLQEWKKEAEELLLTLNQNEQFLLALTQDLMLIWIGQARDLAAIIPNLHQDDQPAAWHKLSKIHDIIAVLCRKIGG